MTDELKAPQPLDEQRAARIREVLLRLIEANHFMPVIVEGKNDAAALRALGLEGEILTINRGRSLYEICEDLAEAYDEVVLLMDWDTRGEELNTRLCRELAGMWEGAALMRAALRALCQKDIGSVEGIPALLVRLHGDA